MQVEMYSHIYNLEKTHWWYVARRKIIFDWALRVLSEYKLPRVLDVGCGTGFNVSHLRSRGYMDVIGVDFSKHALHFCQSRNLKSLVCGDGIHLPFQDGEFDVIMALDMIEHLEDDGQVLNDLARVLKSGGALIIFVPAFNFLWGLQDEVSHHYRRYTAGELGRKLTEANLTPQKLTYANMFLFPAIWAGRMLWHLMGDNTNITSENDLHPGWSNGLLQNIFAAERSLLRHINFPVGVSLFCIATK